MSSDGSHAEAVAPRSDRILRSNDRAITASGRRTRENPLVPFRNQNYISTPGTVGSPAAKKSKKSQIRPQLPAQQLILRQHGGPFVSLMSFVDFIKLAVASSSRTKSKSIRSMICSPREWIEKCLTEDFPIEDILVKYLRDSLKLLLLGLNQPLPNFILPLKSNDKTRDRRATSIPPEDRLQAEFQINKNKEEIMGAELEEYRFRMRVTANAIMGLEELKLAIEKDRRNDDSSNLPSEEKLERFERKLVRRIGEILDILVRRGRLSSRGKPMINQILCGKQQVFNNDVLDKIDGSTISLLVNALHILRIEKKGKHSRLVLTDFSS